jgi:hypothetical protein
MAIVRRDQLHSASWAGARSPCAGFRSVPRNDDVAIDKEDKAINRKLKSICRGC